MSESLAVQQVDITDAVNDMWRSVLLFVPRALAFLAILIVGWLIARLALRVIDKVLERVGFDRAVERGGVGRALERTRYDASDILARLVYYAVLLFTLQLAFGVWGPNPISDLISAVVAWLPRAFVAIVIVVVAAAIANAVRDLVTGALGGLSYGRVLATLASIFILALGVIAALNQVGIATTVTTPVLVAVLATVAGILIVGVGGGLVRPMQQRWEGWLERAETESRVIREKSQAYSAGRGDVRRQMAERQGAQPQAAPRPQGAPAMSGAEAAPGSTATGQGVYQSGSAPGGGPGAEPSPAMSDDETRRMDLPDYRDR
jgi:Conserved TM helix